jgi:hypothetical protein
VPRKPAPPPELRVDEAALDHWLRLDHRPGLRAATLELLTTLLGTASYVETVAAIRANPAAARRAVVARAKAAFLGRELRDSAFRVIRQPPGVILDRTVVRLAFDRIAHDLSTFGLSYKEIADLDRERVRVLPDGIWLWWANAWLPFATDAAGANAVRLWLDFRGKRAGALLGSLVNPVASVGADHIKKAVARWRAPL